MYKPPNFRSGKEPQYQTEATYFITIFYNLNWGKNKRMLTEKLPDRVNGSVEEFGINEESSVKSFGDFQRTSVKLKQSGRTAHNILTFFLTVDA